MALDLDADEALRIAADAGRAILESGGETYRAEEVMMAFLTAAGMWDIGAFATPTGIMLSCSDASGANRSVVRRIRKRQMNLERVARTHDLARDAVGGRADLDRVQAELCRIDETGPYRQPLPLIGAALIAGFFCLLFGGVVADAVMAAVIGLGISRLSAGLASLRLSDFFINIACGAIVVMAGMIGAGIVENVVMIGIHSDKAIIGATMLLVPGVTITNAIRDTINGDLVAGIARGADAFIAAAGISIGAGVALKTWSLMSGSL